MNRHAKVREIQQLCEDVHREGGWDSIPWSPNDRAVCLEAIERGFALFSTYAHYEECADRVAGTFKLPLKECTFQKLTEETELAIGFSSLVQDQTQLTRLSEAKNLHMSPVQPGSQGGVDLPLETLGGMTGDGPADSGTDREPHAGGFKHQTVMPSDPAQTVHELTVDHMGTAMPGGARRQPIGTPEHDESDEILPDKGIGRTNVHGVAVPEWSSAGQIDPDRVKQTVERMHTSIQDPNVQMSDEDVKAFKEWFEAEVFTAESGDEFIQQALRVRDEVARVTGWQWNESEEPWMQAWKTTLDEAVITRDELMRLGHGLAPENVRRTEMGRKDYRHAIAVIVRDGSKVLLGKAQASDDRDGYWCFPGGGIDAEDGGDPVSAAIREAYEEAGIKVASKGVILDHPDKPTCAFVVCEFADREDRLPEPNEEFAEFAWLDYDVRFETPMKIYPVNKSVLERIPRDALYNSRTGRNQFHVKEGALDEETALKRQKPNKRAWAVSSNSRRITTGINAEPNRRSKSGSTDKTKDRPSDKAVAATQNIKGKKTLSSPSAPQDSAEKLHFQTGSKNPRKAAQDKKAELDRVKQGRDPAALKPGDEGTPGKADAEKEAKAGKAPSGGGSGGAGGGGQKPAAGPSMPSPQQAATMPVNDLVQAAQAVLAAAGVGGAAAPGGAAPAAPGGKQPAQKPNGKAGQATASDSPASKEKKDKQTKAQSPGASTPTEPQQPAQQPGQAAPPGQMPQQQGQPGPQQGQVPGQSAGAGGMQQQAPQPGQPGQMQQPGQQAPQQPGMQQSGMQPGQPQPIQPTQGMPGGQPGINGDMTAPGMQAPQPQGMPAFQQRVVDLVLKDRGNAEKCFRWLQALGFNPTTPDHTTVQVIAQSHEDMHMVTRTAKVFGLELSGLMP